MTTFVKESIDEALEATGYRIEEMSSLESVFFRKKILETFSDGREHRALWESAGARDGFSVCDANAWQWLDDFLLPNEFYLFFGMIQQSISFQKINPLLSSKMNSPVIFFILRIKI